MAGKIKIDQALIHPYHSIEEELTIKLTSPVTAVIGENEAGKTSILEAIGKANYYIEKDKFVYGEDDYPRRLLTNWDDAKDIPAVTFIMHAEEGLLNEIKKDTGIVPQKNKLVRTTMYSGKKKIEENGFNYDIYEFWDEKLKQYSSLKSYRSHLTGLRNERDFMQLRHQLEKEHNPAAVKDLDTLKKYIENPNDWINPINEYVYRTWIWPNLPQFIYYEEWNTLPASIDLGKLVYAKDLTDENRMEMAFLSLLNLDAKKLLEMPDGAELDTLLELVSAELTKDFLQVWHNNERLRIELSVVHKPAIKGPKTSMNPFQRAPILLQGELVIRIRDVDAMVTLPLNKRSKGFQWYFSFWIWFSAIQKIENTPYIMLLDEPGLHLHENAQLELMKLFQEISQNNPIVFSTHSNIMADSNMAKVYLAEKKNTGTVLKEI